MRDEARKALLAPYAPTQILNDWWGAEEGTQAMPIVDLSDLHPVTAIGMVDWLNDRSRITPQSIIQKLMPVLAGIEAKAGEG